MDRSEFLNCIARNVNRIRAYELGHDGSGGTCDCIGQIIGAVRLCGEKWPWTHGSNYAARNRVRNFRKISAVSDLRLGELVFKGRAPGETGYSLPSKYNNSEDRTDYYHVGVVTSIVPFEITHCTGVDGGIKRDSKIGKWGFAGEQNLLTDSGEENEVMMNGLYEAKVYAENGGNVNLRAKPDKNGALIKKIAVGTTVTVTEECDAEWAAVIVGEKTGYMMRKFLQPIGETDIFVGDGYDADRDERLAIALEKIIEIAQSALYGEAKG